MNGLRNSHSAEAARAAALQAEFNEKKWVWVPDEKEGYLAGWVHQEDQETAEIIMSSGGEVALLEFALPPLLTFRSDTPSSALCLIQDESPKIRPCG